MINWEPRKHFHTNWLGQEEWLLFGKGRKKGNKYYFLNIYYLPSTVLSIFTYDTSTFRVALWGLIFPHFIGSPFTLLFPLLCRSFTVWCSPTCLLIYFCLCFGHFQDLCQEDFLLCFLLGFLVPGFMFKSLICFKLIFIYSIRKGLNFIISCVDI